MLVKITSMAAVIMCISVLNVSAENEGPSPVELRVMVDTLWVMLAGMLVFFMNAGFGMLETGFCRAKNAVNILAKNFVVFGLASIAYWLIGFALMFSNGFSIGGFDLIGNHGFMLNGADNSPAVGDAYNGIFGPISWAGVPLYAKFFFQLVFAGTAATIVSGAVAERVKFQSFILFSFILVALIYPVTGHWIWGGGFLAAAGMWDFAGSTVVHSVGGWAALVGAIVLGPRIGKFRTDGKVNPIPGHNLSLAMLGGMILWLGWFGFNPGSTMAADGSAIAHIALTTNLACSAGILSATCVAWLAIGKPDLSMIINGALAGLVAITAPCAFVGMGSAVLIGAIAGILVVYSVLLFDRLKIDDPVGAISVHLVNGIWGTLAVGLFAVKGLSGIDAGGVFTGGGISLLIAQVKGIFWVGIFVVCSSVIVWKLIDLAMGIRVNPGEEMLGLDIGEHGMEAYNSDAVIMIDQSKDLVLDRISRKEKEKEKESDEDD